MNKKDLLEKILLCFCIMSIEARKKVFSELDDGDFTEQNREVFRAICRVKDIWDRDSLEIIDIYKILTNTIDKTNASYLLSDILEKICYGSERQIDFYIEKIKEINEREKEKERLLQKREEIKKEIEG